MNDRIRQAGRFLQGAIEESSQQALRQRGDEEHRSGFTRAASISMRRLQEKLDVLKEQMQGPGLTKPEQVLYAQLEELRSEIEADFDHYWRGSGVDWRPRTPIAKGVIRQPGKSQ